MKDLKNYIVPKNNMVIIAIMRVIMLFFSICCKTNHNNSKKERHAIKGIIRIVIIGDIILIETRIIK